MKYDILYICFFLFVHSYSNPGHILLVGKTSCEIPYTRKKLKINIVYETDKSRYCKIYIYMYDTRKYVYTYSLYLYIYIHMYIHEYMV